MDHKPAAAGTPGNTLAGMVRSQAQRHEHQPALRFDSSTWTYGQLDAESNRVAQALTAEGIEKGSRVAFLSKSSPEAVFFLLGAAKLGAAVVPINWRLSAREAQSLLAHSQAEVLLLDSANLNRAPDLETPTLRKLVVASASGASSAELESFSHWCSSAPATDPGGSSDSSDTALQIYTSGTTGLPKGVEITHQNLFAAFSARYADWGFDSSNRALAVLPLFHIAGCSWLLASLSCGAQVVLHPEVDADKILRTIEQCAITHAILVPSVLQRLLARPDLEGFDFSSLKTIIYGASPIGEKILTEAISTFGCDFIQAYGLTETTGAVTVLRAEDHRVLQADDHRRAEHRGSLLRSAGMPMGDAELRIVDPETLQPLPEGSVGEVLIRTRQLMKGYFNQPAATRDALLEGKWFRSGDAGYLLDGYLYLHDRIKDVIVSGGENIYPTEIEHTLIAHPAVADVAVIGVPSERWGEEVKAMIVAASAPQNDREILDYCREQLAHYKCPRSIDWIDEIPRTLSGKILKRKLRQPYWEGQERFVG